MELIAASVGTRLSMVCNSLLRGKAVSNNSVTMIATQKERSKRKGYRNPCKKLKSQYPLMDGISDLK
jgi:hypothetical protein